jgi:hypothetical protein
VQELRVTFFYSLSQNLHWEFLRLWEAALKELKSENVTTWIREIPDPRFGRGMSGKALSKDA